MNAPKLEQQLSELLKHLSAGDYPQVQTKGQRLRSHYPDNATLWVIEGIAARRQGDVAAAEDAYRQALRLDPKHPDAAFNLGNLYREQQRWDSALAAYQQALDAHPARADVEFALGELHQIQGHYRVAADYFSCHLAEHPTSARFALALADCQYSLAQPDLARQTLLDLGTQHASELTILLAIEQRFAQYQQWQDAETILRQAIVLYPQEGSLQHNLGALFIKQQRLADALPCFERAYQLGVEAPSTLSNLAASICKDAWRRPHPF